MAGKKRNAGVMRGCELTALRKKWNNMVQVRLGKLLGYNAKHISALERETYPITEKLAKRLKELDKLWEIRGNLDDIDFD